MTDLPPNMCARCRHFRMKEYPDHARVGLGRCMGYDDAHTQLKNPFTHWATKPCARFAKALNLDERQAWIDKQLAKESAKQGMKTISRASA